MHFEQLEAIQHWFVKQQFGTNARIELYESLAILLEGNQVLLIDALRELHSIASEDFRKPNAPRAVVMLDLTTRIADGESLSQALANWAPPEEVSLVSAGEESGRLRGAFEDAIHVIQSKQQIRGAVVKACSYPLLLMVMILALLTVISTKMIPKLAKITNPEKWDGAAALMYKLAGVVQHQGIWLLGGAIILLLLIFLSLPHLRGPLRVWLDRIPPWSIYRTVHGSTFLLTVAVMLQSGIRLHDALSLLTEHANPWLRERIEGALYGTGAGGNLGVALEQAGHDFPDRRAIQFLRVLSSRDGFEEAIARFGNRWLGQCIRSIDGFAKLSFGIGMGIVGALMFLIVAGIAGINDSVTSNLR